MEGYPVSSSGFTEPGLYEASDATVGALFKALAVSAKERRSVPLPDAVHEELVKLQVLTSKTVTGNPFDTLLGDVSPSTKVNTTTLVEMWNRLAAKTGGKLRRVMEITAQRRQSARRRIRERPFLSTWLEIFQAIERSSFLTGRTGGARSWVVSFDWIVKNETNVVKILEGRYEDRDEGPTEGGGDRRSAREVASEL